MTGKTERDTNDTLGLFRSKDHLIGIPTKALSELMRIEELVRLPSERPEVLGAITLRNTILPVLDTLALFGLKAQTQKPGIAAVVSRGNSQIALAFDQVEDLYRYKTDALQTILGPTTNPLRSSQLNTPSGLVTVIDTNVLFDDAEIPRAVLERSSRTEKKDGGLTPHLIFRAGGVTYAVDVENIFSTSPGATLERPTVQDTVFLGMVTYLNHQIPVADINSVLKIDTRFEEVTPEIVILRLNEGKLLGLAVDEILNISHLDLPRLSLLPDFIQKGAPLIKTTLTDPTQTMNVLVLDVTACQNHDSLRDLTRMGTPPPSLEPDFDVQTQASKNFHKSASKVRAERVRNILFFAGTELATPAKSIMSVIKPPSKVIPWHSDVIGLRGLFTFQDEMLPLVDLAVYRGGEATQETQQSRVLVSEESGRKVGFLVDRIGSISLSKSYIENSDGAPDFVEIQDWPKNRLVCQIPMKSLAWAVSESL
jgi:chemotaxis signal transduction protein